MGASFAPQGRIDEWAESARVFHQLELESILQYEDHFKDEIVDSCLFSLEDRQQQFIFYQGLRPEYMYPMPLHDCMSMMVLRAQIAFLIQTQGGCWIPPAPAASPQPVPPPPPAQPPHVPPPPAQPPVAPPVIEVFDGDDESVVEDSDDEDPIEDYPLT